MRGVGGNYGSLFHNGPFIGFTYLKKKKSCRDSDSDRDRETQRQTVTVTVTETDPCIAFRYAQPIMFSLIWASSFFLPLLILFSGGDGRLRSLNLG